MTLYGVPPTRAIRPIWLLNELDLVCRIENILPFDAESVRAVKALNPIGKIPYLVDGNLTI
ncbi:glutathione S-transferase N-terminal domain-containing protein [Paracoccus rhizosphaerae]|uniref:Glutathione S-transferase N-terminal domain-containing protein n=1 Tax=Paracoccus rhizosphaerae TaxID=1133347 RepID=A0ABV6CJQ5_9RHOB